MDVTPKNERPSIDLHSEKAQELLGVALSILQNSGLRVSLLRTFGEKLVEQIINVLCIQYLMYVAVNEGMDTQKNWDEILDKISPEMFDEHTEFVSIVLSFYENDEDFNIAEHPIDLKELEFGNDADQENSDLIKLIVLMFNKHFVSDAIYDRLPEENKSLQLSKVLLYANAYIDHCQEQGMVSVYNILMNQRWIIALQTSLTSPQEEDESKGAAK